MAISSLAKKADKALIMCGITGFFHFNQDVSNQQAPLQAMMERIKHRGPDDEGTALGKWYALGHVRLAILDPTPLGHQPMMSADKRYILIYNGEIYNFKTLRNELEALGHRFKSQSDTEVLLNGLIEWGQACFSKLEGMFTGVFVDTQAQEAWMFRDQMGIKPLYYIQDKGKLAFASEVKALWPFWGQPKLNEAAVFEQLRYRMTSGERTLYQDVFRLPPGSVMHIKKDGSRSLKRYYSITNHIFDAPNEPADLDQIESWINESIHTHTVSDVGYAVQLSGGVDSSYIANVLSRDQANLEAYAITLPGLSADEEIYQNIVAKQCGITLHRYPCSGSDFAALLPKTIEHLDFPLIHGGSVFLYFLCSHIAEKHKVVLTGEGADELFGGYSRYKISNGEKLAFRLKQLGFSPKLIPDLPKFRGLKNLMNRDLGRDADTFDMPVIAELVNTGIDDLSPARIDTTAPFKTLIAQIVSVDQTAYLGSLLERQDKISMAHGVEVRVPFCTSKLFERMNKIRITDKLKPVPKALLKKLLEKDFSHDFVYRRKNGFVLPFAEWLRDDKALSPYIDLLTTQKFKNYDFINHTHLSTVIDNHRQQKQDYSKELFGFMSFALWAEQAGV